MTIFFIQSPTVSENSIGRLVFIGIAVYDEVKSLPQRLYPLISLVFAVPVTTVIVAELVIESTSKSQSYLMVFHQIYLFVSKVSHVVSVGLVFQSTGCLWSSIPLP